MAEEMGKYNIKAICNKLGIQPGTLRAWERRYHIISPVRNEAGHRLYTDSHVRIIEFLIEKVQTGFTIGQAVQLYEADRQLTEQNENTPSNRAVELREKMQTSLLAYDEWGAHKGLNDAFNFFSIEKVVEDIITPLLYEVGDLWHAGVISTAQEHFSSQFLRTRIGMLLHSIPPNPFLPKVICVCGVNETHEMGILLFTLFLRRKGFDVVYLGAAIQSEDLPDVIKKVQPGFLFMSATIEENVVPTWELVQSVEKSFPNLEVGLGGRAFHIVEGPWSGHTIGNYHQDWNEWIGYRLKSM
ncbi:MAG: MerR family transcriptional regulator [Bacilli bacterium]